MVQEELQEVLHREELAEEVAVAAQTLQAAVMQLEIIMVQVEVELGITVLMVVLVHQE